MTTDAELLMVSEHDAFIVGLEMMGLLLTGGFRDHVKFVSDVLTTKLQAIRSGLDKSNPCLAATAWQAMFELQSLVTRLDNITATWASLMTYNWRALNQHSAG